MRRDIFTADHEAFRDVVRSFIKREVEPHHEQRERAGVVSREVWLAAGRAGLLGIDIDEKCGGGGNADYRYYLILNQELARAGAHGPGFQVHNDIVGHYLDRLGTQEQRERWLPGYCTGELITAIAITEPGSAAICRGCVPSPHWRGTTTWSNGQKTFISNGQLCDLVIVVARNGPGAGYRELSLLVVERGRPGFTRGRNLDKIGMPAQDTSELFFSDVRVPKTNLLGGRGAGILALMQNLPRERLAIGGSARSSTLGYRRSTAEPPR
jgi:alkylation response protein AidB-like acyl-CoA dehydrogenase